MNRQLGQPQLLWRHRIGLGLGLGLVLSTSCQANDDLIARAGVEMAPACLTCHGPDEEPVAQAGLARQADLGAMYLRWHLLGDFADGRRVMTPKRHMAKPLSVADSAAVSAYYAALPVAASSSAVLPTTLEKPRITRMHTRKGMKHE